MNWLESPYTVVEANTRAERLRFAAQGVVEGATGKCPHPQESLTIDCLTNQSADNRSGPESLVIVHCSRCESTKKITSKTPICTNCSKPTPRGLVWRVTTGKLPAKNSRDYDEVYPCICPKCGDVKEITLHSSYD